MSGPSAATIQARVIMKEACREVGRLLDGAAKETMEAFAKSVAFRAKQIVPRKTGRLRDSIRGSARKRRGKNEVMASVTTNTKGMPLFGKDLKDVRNKKKKKSDVDSVVKYGYGLDVEIGRTDRKYKHTPYLRPAMEQTKGSIKDLAIVAAKRAASMQATKSTVTKRK